MIQGLQNIIKLKPEAGCEWNVYSYVINKDIIDEHGKVDDLRGLIFPLGSFDTLQKAENHAKNIIEKTGYSKVVVAKYGIPIQLSTKSDVSIIETVPVDINGKIINLESKAYEEQQEIYQKKIKYEQELKEECELECDINHIEHYKRIAYLTIKHYVNYLNLKKQLEEIESIYQKRKLELNDHLKLHPEHEKDFLPYFKEKLMKRGEEALYSFIETNYNKYKYLFLD